MSEIQTSTNYREVADAMPVPVLIRVGLEFAYLNEACEGLFGYSREELMGKSILQYLPQGERSPFKEFINKLDAERQLTGPDTTRILTADGQIKLVRSKASPIFFDGEEAYLVVSQGIVEPDEQLLAENLLIDRITEAFPDMFYNVATTQGETLFEKGNIYNYLGYKREDFASDADFMHTIVHPDDQGMVKDMAKRLHNSKIGDDFVHAEYRVKAADGSWHWLQGRSTVIKRNSEGKPKQFLGIVQDITERKEAERRFTEQNEITNRIVDFYPDIVYVMDIRTRENIFLKGSYAEALGYDKVDNSAEDYKLLMERVHPDDLALLTKSALKLPTVKDDDYVETEYRIQDKDGNWRWLFNRSTVFKRDEESGMPVQFFGVVQDVTERKGIESELREHQLLVERITDAVPDIVTVIDLTERKPIFQNTDIIAYLGYEPDAFEGDMWEFLYTLLHPDDYEQIRDANKELFGIPQGKQKYIQTEYRLKDAEGRWRWIYSRSTVFRRDENGQPIQTFAIAQDITRRKEIEEDLNSKSNLIQKITETIPDLIYLTDVKHQENIFENFSLLHYLGYEGPPEGMSDWEYIGSLIHEEDRIKMAEAGSQLKSLKSDKDFLKTEYRLKDVNGDWKWFSSRSTILERNEDGSASVGFGFLQDITSMKATQEELRQKLEQIQETNKELEKYITSNLELEKFAYIASHDLREPLRTIIGFSQLLERRYKDKLDDDAYEFIDHIIGGTKRMETLIQGLLQYSRVDAKGQVFKEVDLNEILDKVLVDLKTAIQESETTINYEELPTIMGDDLQLRQLLQNLLSNAIKFRKPDVKPVIDVTCKAENKKWVITIADNGIGMDMQYKDHIFQIFKRLHNQEQYAGSGIGLSICKRIVERHGGEIWVDSEQGKGSTFYLSFPIEIT